MNDKPIFANMPPNGPPTIIRAHRCETCAHADMIAAKPNVECHRNPPTASCVMQQAPNGKVFPSTYSAFPIMKLFGWCGEWKAKIEMMH